MTFSGTTNEALASLVVCCNGLYIQSRVPVSGIAGLIPRASRGETSFFSGSKKQATPENTIITITYEDITAGLGLNR